MLHKYNFDPGEFGNDAHVSSTGLNHPAWSQKSPSPDADACLIVTLEQQYSLVKERQAPS